MGSQSRLRETLRTITRILNDAGITEIRFEQWGKNGHMGRVTFWINGERRHVCFSKSADTRAFKNAVAQVRQAVKKGDNYDSALRRRPMHGLRTHAAVHTG